ncbi:carbohydrate ABC transporter permease [Desmospora activa]|uniref:Carbohydrate ABC transporter membrane protein 1 (CUT1 family) n=1 Tax=Desmospora activa DSM 45169 TaxID=1121389 RepID=A0A2T4ZBB1_9BACL|nr:sugar ABC transporter permease [Desmospora activa]PTM59183.1 carbohydrate ABC transporter membrane protein 1 (CUT1 family) [Desmospora activa DSM 45169]
MATTTSPPKQQRQRSPKAGRGQKWTRDPMMGYLFTLPVIVSLSVFLIGPIIYAFYLSFQQFTFLNPDLSQFVGLDNYTRLLTDERFHTALKNTSFYSLGVVPVQVSLALLLALIVNSKIRGKTFFRVAYFLPTVTSTVAVSVMFLFLFKRDGLVNAFLSLLGVEGRSWMLDVDFALPSIMLMAVWTTVGQFMVIYLAGLQDIPADLYEAAEVDGAGPLRQFWHITLPLLKPTTFFIVVMSVIGTFQVFDQMYVISKGAGGPLDSTLTVVLYLYNVAFQDFEMGYASAIAFFLFAVILILTLIQRNFFGEETRM